MNIGICMLCQTEQELIDKSHIIPRQFHHYTSKNLEKNADKTSSTVFLYSKYGKSKQTQSGLFMGGILCKKCENLIGKWDKYAQEFLLRDINSISKLEAQGTKMQLKCVKDFNYNSLKLFFITCCIDRGVEM